MCFFFNYNYEFTRYATIYKIQLLVYKILCKFARYNYEFTRYNYNYNYKIQLRVYKIQHECTRYNYEFTRYNYEFTWYKLRVYSFFVFMIISFWNIGLQPPWPSWLRRSDVTERTPDRSHARMFFSLEVSDKFDIFSNIFLKDVEKVQRGECVYSEVVRHVWKYVEKVCYFKVKFSSGMSDIFSFTHNVWSCVTRCGCRTFLLLFLQCRYEFLHGN